MSYANQDGKRPGQGYAEQDPCANLRAQLTAAQARVAELEKELAAESQRSQSGWELVAIGIQKYGAMKDERDALRSQHAACLAELRAISQALGANEGHSSVDHIKRLRTRAEKAEGDARWFVAYAGPFMQDMPAWRERAKPYETP